MSWDEWKQQRAHYLEKKARISKLEAQLAEKNEYIIQLECAVNNLQQNTITAMSERDTLADDCSKLKAQLASAYRDKMHLEDTCNFQHEMLLSCQRDTLRDALASLSNEFDRMHTMVSSRYVAERLQALEKET